jgi:iron complex outermembrane receptor protein
MFDPAIVEGMQAPAIKAELSADDALARLLAGTKLHAVRVDANTIRVMIAEGVPTRTTSIGEAPTISALYEPRNPQLAEAEMNSGTQPRARGEASEVADAAEKKTRMQLEQVTVTGSRLPDEHGASLQDVKVYDRAAIVQSGQGTLPDFLGTLPMVSVSFGENALQFNATGATTVQLRGMPVGSTLILIDGRRVETSGLAGGSDFFDLNSIPLSAVERVDVLSGGSSAIYGSDAIAGVINIFLKKDIRGVSANAEYGWANNLNEKKADVSAGHVWDNGSISLVSNYQRRGELTTTERPLTKNNNYTAFGSRDANYSICPQANVFSLTGENLPGLNSPYAAVPPNYYGRPSLAEFQNTAGALNQCSILQATLIPSTERWGLFLQGRYEISSSAEIFTEILYSNLKENNYVYHPFLFGQVGFQSFTVSGSNPYNPFGTTVGISKSLSNVPREGYLTNTDYFRPLIGIRGSVFNQWHWELAAWESIDWTREVLQNQLVDSTGLQNALNASDPATALNPFVDGPLGTQAQLAPFFSNGLIKVSGKNESIEASMRGTALQLPAGPVATIVGFEHDRQSLYNNNANVSYAPSSQSTYGRSINSIFVEARIPILPPARQEYEDALEATVAARYDHFSDFGSTTNPQLGLQWKPIEPLVIRGTYSRSFKAPPLSDLFTPQQTFPSTSVFDPTKNETVLVPYVTGGNPRLRPETGRSNTVGIVYVPKSVPEFRLALTHWYINESSAIQSLLPQTIVSNETLFPGNVIRDAQGNIKSVTDEFVNFGDITARGVDYQLEYSLESALGTWRPTLLASQTYRYTETLAPGAPTVDATSRAQDSGDWAPRWKGTASLGWKLGLSAVTIAGRYVGKYQDYDSERNIGNFWLFDANVHVDLGRLVSLTSSGQQAYLEIGGTNIFNRAPQFSNAFGDTVGYDPRQSDILGRFLYVRIGAKL